MDIDEYVLHL
jgi:hypothetical protein